MRSCRKPGPSSTTRSDQLPREASLADDTTTIRPVRHGDRAAWEPLWHGYHAFYHSSPSEVVTATTWGRFFDPGEPVHALVAERDGTLVGLVHFLFHRNTWMIAPVCYLQDLFTAPAARGHGVGRCLIEAVYAEAGRAGSERVYWMTQENNATARALYDTVADNSGFIQYRKRIPPSGHC